MKVRYYWSEDGLGEVCDYEKAITPKNVQCTHCDTPILNGSKCVQLKNTDDDVYWLHSECAEKGVSFLSEAQSLYWIARDLDPVTALNMIHQAQSEEERDFYTHIADMIEKRIW